MQDLQVKYGKTRRRLQKVRQRHGVIRGPINAVELIGTHLTTSTKNFNLFHFGSYA